MIYNRENGKKIIENERHAKTFFSRFKGLMLIKNFDYGLIFHLPNESKSRAAIHMLFMRTAIDVIFLNEEKRVVDIVKGLKPWTLNYAPKEAAKYIIELPPATIQDKVKLNDLIGWSQET